MRDRRVVEILSSLTQSGKQDSLPARLCAACLSALPVSGVGAALMTADGPTGVVLGEGPCVEASDGGRPVLEPDLVAAGSPRWPRFGTVLAADVVNRRIVFDDETGGVAAGRR